MVNRLRRRQGGFTLIELLIVVAIIGIIAALLIPNFLDALQKAKQKRTVADERNVGTAMMSWLTDEAAAAAAGQAATSFNLSSYSSATVSELEAELVPRYIQKIPNLDGWKHSFNYYLAIADPLREQVMAIHSGGRDDSDPAGNYAPGAFDPTDYDQDIVWADGFFVRWPQKTT